MHSPLNRLSLWIARKRKLQSLFSPLLPKTATFKVIDELQVQIPLNDQTGPSFYLNYGGPSAFYHYEEIEKTELLRALPADGVFLDIGANIGLFTFYLAKLLPQLNCYAFEPDPLLAHCIRNTIKKSHFDRVRVEELCFLDQSKKVELCLHRKNSGGHSIISGNIDPGEQRSRITVQGISLDDWMSRGLIQRLDALKIDVQGAELLVLQGGAHVIQKYRPFILIEMDHSQLLKNDSEWMRFLGTDVLKSYRFRVAGSAQNFSLSELKKVAANQVSHGQLHANYFLMPHVE